MSLHRFPSDTALQRIERKIDVAIALTFFDLALSVAIVAILAKLT